ncbi:MAG: tetratricopeptide repeat protein [Patescibacteria group bacterium]
MIKENRWQIIGLIGLALMIYLPTLNHQFIADDIFGIVNNPEIFKWGHVWQNPLVVLNRLEYWLIVNTFGVIPWPFRLVNILVHLMTAIGGFVLTEKLINKTVATVAAVLIIVHPLMIESVTWISGNGYSWYGMLLVWSLIFYLRAGKNWQQWLISVGLFLAALEFSEKAAVLPGILLVYRLAIDRKRGQWWDLAPYVFLSGLWLWLNLMGVGARLNYLQTEYNSNISIKPTIFVQMPVALTNYLGLMVWPDKLTLYHSELDVTKSKFIFMAGITMVYFLITGWCLLKGLRAGFFMSWLIIGLSPTLIPLGVAWIVAERYVYFASIGIYILIAWGLVSWSQKQEEIKIGWAVTVIIIISFLIRTMVRNQDWQDQDHLWLAAERTSPSSSQNHNNLGDLYGRRGDFNLSERHFKQAIELNPNYADAMHNLANIYVRLGQLEEAIKWYESALKNKPSLWQSEQQLKAVKDYLQTQGQ